MESIRRSIRPRFVDHALRLLRMRAWFGANAVPVPAVALAAAAQGAVPQKKYSQPQLSVIPGGAQNEPPDGGTPAPAPAPKRSRVKRILLAVFLLLVVVLAGLAWLETRSSTLQAKFFAQLAAKLSYRMEDGPSDSIRFPSDSPYDERLGYANLPDYLGKLKTHDYAVNAQARISPKMAELADMGLFATYPEKTRVGLDILDRNGQALFSARYPERTYGKFDDAPSLLVQSLLFIENRELLDTTYPKRNPAVEWDRFSKAVFDKTLHSVGLGGGGRVAGGSTLATQIEKYRHSSEGRTTSLTDKLRQMASATLRAYQGGEDTTDARRRIVLEYLNTVPLSAKVGYGEVNGIGDGMWVWYGRDFARVNKMLGARTWTPEAVQAYKEALSLMIAQRRPAYYLGAGTQDLEVLTDSHLRVLAQAGVITPQIRDAALAVKLHPSTTSGIAPTQANAFVSRKAANAVRNHLAGLLGDPRLYNLDRLDLSVKTTLDADAQKAVTAMLRKLSTNDAAAAAGLTGKGMLGNGDPSKVVYSFTLMERGRDVNYLRVQTDNFDQPLDINEGAKLDLGSTAKLRTLVTYLDIIDQLHQRYGKMSKTELAAQHIDPKDHLSQWGVDYFRQLPDSADRGLPAMLDASLERKYSGSPGEAFFTGGGVHTFGNFSKLDDHRILTVRQATQNSTNLVFVRLMRDVVRYYMFQLPGSSAALLADADDPRRAEYLARFADKEGQTFLAKFWNKYKGKSFAEAESLLLQGLHPTPAHLAAVHRSIHPEATPAQFGAFINDNLPSKNEVEEDKLATMYDTYSPDNMSLADRGYVSSVHPLELWLVNYLRTHPKAGWDEVVHASVKERQDVYSWLFKTHRKHAQDNRIAGLIEVEAFLKIHAQWKKMGYPFDSLVPSYATTLGASADRPAALAEMMGILVNGGVRKPVERIDSLHFAKDTPYETLVKRAPTAGSERVLSADVARAALDTIRGVVAEGTAKRAKHAFVQSDGSVIAVGGKTGTGDQRFDVYAKGGHLIESRFVNRSATFVFNIGERFFGTMTAYVHGPDSANYDFTSALPVQLLVSLAPSLMPMIEPHAANKAVAGKQGDAATALPIVLSGDKAEPTLAPAASAAPPAAADPAVATAPAAAQAATAPAAPATAAPAPAAKASAAAAAAAATPAATKPAAPAPATPGVVVVDEKAVAAAARARAAEKQAGSAQAPQAKAAVHDAAAAPFPAKPQSKDVQAGSGTANEAAQKHPKAEAAAQADPAKRAARAAAARRAAARPQDTAQDGAPKKDPRQNGALQNQLF
jgi:membrane peptidoglycan carboxypeptidase